MTIAIGIGAYAGLSGLSGWRRASNDASFRKLAMHDLRINLPAGSSVPSGQLSATVRGIPSAGQVTHVEERLIAPTQVDASLPGRTIVTPGRLVGIPVAGDGSKIDLIHRERGRGLEPSDDGRFVAILESSYARHYELPNSGTVTVAGGRRIEYVGHGQSPEYFIVTTDVGFFGSEANFAVIFVPLGTAQALTGDVGRVNDAVIRLAPGTDVGGVTRELTARFGTNLPNAGATVLSRRDNDGFRILYDDIDGDQEIYNIFALILLGAGTFAAFNLASRIVESQRRELGVGMALGVSPWALAIRPLLLGVQIAVAGLALGIPFGIWVGNGFLGVFQEALPLPQWRAPFPLEVYARGAALGVVLPVLATAYPTWRAVRMPPIRAVQAGFRAARGGGLAPIARRITLPGGTLGRMPIRNLLRAPRRTLLTVLGISAAITTVVGVTGMVDSFLDTIDRNRSALVGSSPDRMQLTLNDFVRRDNPVIGAIATTPGVNRSEAAIATAATLSTPGVEIDVSLEVLDADSGIWRPTISKGRFTSGSGGIVITEKAAQDLDVQVGEQIVLRHPKRVADNQLRLVETPVTIVGLHPNPIRIYAYMDHGSAALFGLAGATNLINLVPATGSDIDVLKKRLLDHSDVASVERVAATSDALSTALSDYTNILRIVEVVALALALLIAFNSASIAADERSREYATMFAYGVPLRTVLRNSMSEGAIAGLLATLVGVATGLLLIRYIVNVITPRVAPDLGAVVSPSAATIALAVVLGVGATSVAPLLTIRKLSRMDVPATLRVVE